MSEKRFTRGKGLFQDGFFTETINDKKTGERYYDGVKPNYRSSIEIVALLNSLNEENEQLRQKIKHCVYVDVDNENGCMNCKYDEGSICSILNCGTHDYLEGVSECGLKYWECKEDE